MDYKSLLEDGEQLTMWKIIRRMGIGKNSDENLKEKVVYKILKSI